MEENLKLKKHHKLIIAADGSAASGKTTGAKKISKKYGLKFLSSGLLYRYASFLLLKHKPKNKINFLKKCFKNLSLKKLDNKNLHSPKISAYTSIIAKEQKIRIILKAFQIKFTQRYNKVCIEGRDIGTVILPKADIKFFFKCNLDIAAKRRFKELRKNNKQIKLADVKKAMHIRDNLDKKRKNSPLIQAKNAVIVRTDKLKNITGMLNKMSQIIEVKIKDKYGS
ncbi:MAG: 3-phosphoshikimate 1-carboxyvinyltransferase/cytidylate kinase [Pelagibacterales bacterium]|nr:3-phosphoshikimate 1-carboxyvinyltransferase/cytidylate kinase [Pelagibacterales bacterium]